MLGTACSSEFLETVHCALIRELSCWVSQLRQRTLCSGSQQSETARWKKRRGIHVWLVDNNSLWYSHEVFQSVKKVLVLDQCLWVKRLDQNKLIYFKNEFHGKKKKISCWKALLKNNIFCLLQFTEKQGDCQFCEGKISRVTGHIVWKNDNLFFVRCTKVFKTTSYIHQ